MKRTIIATLLSVVVSAGSIALAQQNTVVTETTTWKSVPIQVDTGANTYTVVGPVPTDTTDYYYTYSGYRCFKQQREVGIDAVIFKASVSGGTDIYCYPDQ